MRSSGRSGDAPPMTHTVRSKRRSALGLLVFAGLAAALFPTGRPDSTSAAASAPSTRAVATKVPARPAVALPKSAPGRQMSWVLAVLNGAKAPNDAEIIRRFASTFRAAVPPDQVRAVFAELAAKGPYRVVAAPASSALKLAIEVTDASGGRTGIEMALDADGRISGLQARPVSTAPRPTTWQGVKDALAKVGTRQGLLAAEVGRDGKPSPIATLNQDLAQPIGSTFKLYVLGALARKVADGQTSWARRLPIAERYKSLPSGRLQDSPVGRTLPIREFATRMISESDNTATDHLIGLVGSRSVERAMNDMGSRDVGRNVPLLSTRNLFQLKATATPTPVLAQYAAADQAERRRILQELDANRSALRLGKDGVAVWSKPREIDRVEWFASPSDLVRAMTELGRLAERPGLSPLTAILGKNPGVPVGSRWTRVAFKGGSEPGVVSVTWRLVRNDGRVFALSMSASDPKSPIGEDDFINTALGAIDLLGKQR